MYDYVYNYEYSLYITTSASWVNHHEFNLLIGSNNVKRPNGHRQLRVVFVFFRDHVQSYS